MNLACLVPACPSAERQQHGPHAPSVALGSAGEVALEALSLGEITCVLEKKANSTAVSNNASGGARLKPGENCLSPFLTLLEHSLGPANKRGFMPHASPRAGLRLEIASCNKGISVAALTKQQLLVL